LNDNHQLIEQTINDIEKKYLDENK